jgi:hypothetical protein
MRQEHSQTGKFLGFFTEMLWNLEGTGSGQLSMTKKKSMCLVRLLLTTRVGPAAIGSVF